MIELFSIRRADDRAFIIAVESMVERFLSALSGWSSVSVERMKEQSFVAVEPMIKRFYLCWVDDRALSVSVERMIELIYLCGMDDR